MLPLWQRAANAIRSAEETKVHHSSRRRSSVAAGCARAAGGACAADRRIDRLFRERPGSTGPRRGVPRGAPEARVDGGAQHPDRRALGDVRLGVDATIRGGTRLAAAPTPSLFKQTDHRAAASFAVEAIAAPVRDRSDLNSVIAAQARAPNGGLIVMPDAFIVTHRAEITLLAARYRLPAVYSSRIFTDAGGLLSYGSDLVD